MSYLKLLATKRPRNLLELVTQLPNMGVGERVTRATWAPFGDSFWQVTAVRPKGEDGKQGRVWGVLTWRGEVQDGGRPQQIRARLKRIWRWAPPASEAARYRSLLAELGELEASAGAAPGEAAPGEAAPGEVAAAEAGEQR